MGFELAARADGLDGCLPVPWPLPGPVFNSDSAAVLASQQPPAGRDPPGPQLTKTFSEAADRPTKLSRAEQIKRDMEEWRKRNPDRDCGREI
jgi:hypothetical protein